MLLWKCSWCSISNSKLFLIMYAVIMIFRSPSATPEQCMSGAITGVAESEVTKTVFERERGAQHAIRISQERNPSSNLSTHALLATLVNCACAWLTIRAYEKLTLTGRATWTRNYFLRITALTWSLSFMLNPKLWVLTMWSCFPEQHSATIRWYYKL